MWIISYLPNLVTHVITLVGVIGLLAVSIPLVRNLIPSVMLIKIISILLLGFGLFLEGGIAEKDIWQAKVDALEIKLAAARKESGKINTVIVKEYVDKIKVIKQKGDTITEYVDREITVYDKTCPIPQVVIKAHNAAAKNDTTIIAADPVISTIDHNTAVTKMAPKK